MRPNGYHSTGSGRGRGVGRPPARVVAPAPPPPPPKFVLHDVVCPHTAAYLGEWVVSIYNSFIILAGYLLPFLQYQVSVADPNLFRDNYSIITNY